eukprot:5194830-Pyramimonas_sp.AAC.1
MEPLTRAQRNAAPRSSGRQFCGLTGAATAATWRSAASTRQETSWTSWAENPTSGSTARSS